MKKCLVLLLLPALHIQAQEPRLMLSTAHLDSKENEAAVNSVSFSTDQRFLATAARDGLVKIWDIKSGRLIYDLTASEYSASGVFSKEGKFLISAESGTPSIWTIANGKLKYKLKLDPDNFYKISPSETGKYFAAINNAGPTYIWITETGKLVDSAGNSEQVFFIEGDKKFAYFLESKIVIAQPGVKNKVYLGDTGDFISQFDITPDGKKLLVRYANDMIETWDVVNRRKLSNYTLKGAASYTQVALSARQSTIVALDKEGKIHLLDAMTGIEKNTVDKPVYSNSPAFYLDNEQQMLVFRTRENSLGIVDLGFPAGLKILSIDFPYLNGAAFNSEKTQLALYGGNNAALVNLADGKMRMLGLPSFTVHDARIDSRGNTIAIASDAHPAIKTWTFQSGGLINNYYRRLEGYDHTKLQLEKSGSHLISYNIRNNANLGFWDLRSNKKIETWDRPEIDERTNPSTGLFFKRNSFAALNYPGYTRKYSLIQNRFMEERETGLGLMSLSPLENYAILEREGNSETEKLKVADLRTNTSQQLPFTIKNIAYTRFSSDEKWLAIGNKGGAIVIWDLAGSKILKELEYSGYLQAITFSHNNKMMLVHSSAKPNESPIYSYGSKLELYETANWTRSGKTINPAITPEFILFAGDDRKLLTSEKEYFTDVWEVSTGKKLQTLTGSLAMDEIDYKPFGSVILTHTASTLYSWDAKKHSLIYTLNLTDSAGYLARIPSGHFMSPPGAARQLHYVTNDLKVVTFEQLDIKYNRPDLVLKKIGCTDTALINSYRRAWLKRLTRLGIDTSSFREGFTIPEADFESRNSISYQQDKEVMKLRIRAKSTDILDRFNVWINEVPVYGQKGITLRSGSKKMLDTTITVSLSRGENSIETSVTDINGTESYRMPLFVNHSPVKIQQEKVYFIGIGIDQFIDNRYNLQYSTKDIRDLAAAFSRKFGTALQVDTLLNTSVTKENIRALKRKLQASGINDKVIVAYSGHGLLSSELDYYLSTFAVNFEKPELNGLAYEDLENLLDNIPARKKLMFIDACHSGEVDKEEQLAINIAADSLGLIKGFKPLVKNTRQLGLANSFELMQSLFVNVGKTTGATVISAAAGNQFALERGDLKNGVFTYTILEALENNSSMPVSRLGKLISQRVEALTQGMQKPTNRNEQMQVDWNLW